MSEQKCALINRQYWLLRGSRPSIHHRGRLKAFPPSELEQLLRCDNPSGEQPEALGSYHRAGGGSVPGQSVGKQADGSV